MVTTTVLVLKSLKSQPMARKGLERKPFGILRSGDRSHMDDWVSRTTK